MLLTDLNTWKENLKARGVGRAGIRLGTTPTNLAEEQQSQNCDN